MHVRERWLLTLFYTLLYPSNETLVKGGEQLCKAGAIGHYFATMSREAVVKRGREGEGNRRGPVIKKIY